MSILEEAKRHSKQDKLKAKLKRYEAALKEIAQTNNPVSLSGCPDIARKALSYQD